jgi:RNase P subunit RPR2
MVLCQTCKAILTIVNITVNIKREHGCETFFDCHNCGSQTRVVQELLKGPTKKNYVKELAHV